MYPTEDEVRKELRSLGAFRYETHLPEVGLLSHLIQEGEDIVGAIFGNYKHFVEKLDGHGLLVATNLRLIILQRRPMNYRLEEIPYLLLNGFSFAKNKKTIRFVLETKVGDITMRTRNTTGTQILVRSLHGILADSPSTHDTPYPRNRFGQ